MRKLFLLFLITALMTLLISCGNEYYPTEFRVYYEKGTSKSGDVPVDPRTYPPHSKAIVLDKGTLENGEYIFLGWMGYKLYQPGDEIIGTEDVYLVAVWDDNIDDAFFKFLLDGNEAIITGYTGDSSVSILFPHFFSGKPVTAIENNVFRNKRIYSVSLSKNLKRIGHFTFADCKMSMSTLTIPDSIVSIGAGAFQNNSIKNINFGTGLTSISKGTFSGNELNSVNLPENIVLVDDGAFYGNEIDQIFIGADVEIGNDTSLGTNGKSFKKFYEDSGRQAGEYNYTAGIWLLLP